MCTAMWRGCSVTDIPHYQQKAASAQMVEWVGQGQIQNFLFRAPEYAMTWIIGDSCPRTTRKKKKAHSIAGCKGTAGCCTGIIISVCLGPKGFPGYKMFNFKSIMNLDKLERFGHPVRADLSLCLYYHLFPRWSVNSAGVSKRHERSNYKVGMQGNKPRLLGKGVTLPNRSFISPIFYYEEI